MAEAFTDRGRSSYKYQYSVGVAQHGADVAGYFGPRPATNGPDFELAFMSTYPRPLVSHFHILQTRSA